MKTKTEVKFPSGETGLELLHYMGADDEQTIHERPEVAQRLAAKCHLGKKVELEKDELIQLINEVENALDIKADHVGNGSWSALQQYGLEKYLKKLRQLLLTV